MHTDLDFILAFTSNAQVTFDAGTGTSTDVGDPRPRATLNGADTPAVERKGWVPISVLSADADWPFEMGWLTSPQSRENPVSSPMRL